MPLAQLDLTPSLREKGSPSRTLFIPEELTPLAYTSIYPTLLPEQRVRYNQLSGLHLLEQTIFFEQSMGRPVLERLIKITPPALRENLKQFLEEENRHSSWFRTLLRECEPTWYRDSDFHLLQAEPFARFLLDIAVHHPRLFSCLLWVQLIAEERSQYFSGSFLTRTHEIDSRFVEVQRKHLADEADHIRWDLELIEWLWAAQSTPRRRINARILRWAMREFFYMPKRSGWSVVETLMGEYPDLLDRRDQFREAMRGLSTNIPYLSMLYPRTVFPRTRRLAARFPELRWLEDFFSA